LIFSASITPSSAAAVIAALDIIEAEPERRERLWKTAKRALSEYKRLGFNTAHTQSPIIPIVIGEDLECFSFWKDLYDEGVFTNPVVSPAVPPGQAMIRTSWTATHTDEHVDRVVEVLAKVGRRRGLIS
jgi:7-keto-8-aminopelargonate synthetase-like enzyme